MSSLVPAASTLAMGGLSPDRTIPVQTETFDRWLDGSGIERVDLVKIDAEGAEAEVVQRHVRRVAKTGESRRSCAKPSGAARHTACYADSDSVPQAIENIGHLTNIAYARPQ